MSGIDNMRNLLFLLCFCFSLQAYSEGPSFRLVTENFPPFNYSVNNKTFEHDEADITGLCTEIVQEIFKKANLEYKLKLRQWDYAYGYAQKKANRGVFCTTLTDERKPLFKWVGPLASNDWVIFAGPKFKDKIKSESDLSKYKIGAYKGDVRSDYLKSKGFNVSELSDDRLNPERLDEGMIDLWITSSFAGPKLAKEAGVNDLKAVFTVKEAQLYLAVNKQTDDQWIKILNDKLKELVNDGFVSEMTKKYK